MVRHRQNIDTELINRERDTHNTNVNCHYAVIIMMCTSSSVKASSAIDGGVLIRDITLNSPADNAGLKVSQTDSLSSLICIYLSPSLSNSVVMRLYM